MRFGKQSKLIYFVIGGIIIFLLMSFNITIGVVGAISPTNTYTPPTGPMRTESIAKEEFLNYALLPGNSTRNAPIGNTHAKYPLPMEPKEHPTDSLFMFKNTQFKPECCKTSGTYSNSSGCACMTQANAEYLWKRGGNNVPYIKGITL